MPYLFTNVFMQATKCIIFLLSVWIKYFITSFANVIMSEVPHPSLFYHSKFLNNFTQTKIRVVLGIFSFAITTIYCYSSCCLPFQWCRLIFRPGTHNVKGQSTLCTTCHKAYISATTMAEYELFPRFDLLFIMARFRCQK